MEIGFIIIMLCLVMMASTFIYLVYHHGHRSCKNCKFFKPTANSKYSGTCNGFGHHRSTGSAVENGNVKQPTKRMNFKIMHLWAITSNKA